MKELENYIVQTGEGGTKYEIPAGELGNNTGSSVSFILPDGYNAQTNIAGYIEGEVNDYVAKGSWDNVSSDILNGSNSSIVIELNNGNFGQEAQKINAQANLEKLDYVYNLVGGNNESVTLYGSSNGSVFAIDAAAENKRGNYDVSITNVVVADYYDSHNRAKIPMDNLTVLADADVSITAITDSENTNNTVTGVRKLLIDYSQIGGKALLGEFEGTRYEHVYKCIEPIKRGILGFISGDNELLDGEKKILFTEYLNGEKSSSTLSYDKVKEFFGNSGTSSSSVVSVEYQFINSYMDKLATAIKDTNILSVGNITSSTNGSATLLSAVNAFNNYSNNSTQFLSSLSVLQNNILVIAQSYANLDSELAVTIDSEIINNINNIDLSSVNKFFDMPIAIDISESDGNIIISKNTLSNFISESNLLISTLLSDISDTKELKNIIDSFSSESITQLKGEEWDIIRSKCNEFSELCDKKVNYAESLINSITDACKKLLEYLEDYDELDTSKIDEFEEEKQATIDSIKSLNQTIDELKAEEGTFLITDAYGNTIGSYTIDNSALILSCEMLIESYEQIEKELERVLEKLYGLAGIDNSTSDIIIDTENQNKTENLGQSILSGIVSGGTVGILAPNYDINGGNSETSNNNTQENNQNKDESAVNSGNTSANNAISSNNNTSSSGNNSNTTTNNNTLSNGNSNNQASSIENNVSSSNNNNAASNNNISSNTNNNNQTSTSDNNSSSVSSDNNISSTLDKDDNTLQGENDIEADTNIEDNNQTENITTPVQEEDKVENNINQNTTVNPSTTPKKSNGVKSTILKVVGGIGVAAGTVGGAIGIKKKIDKNNQIDDEENKENSEE